MEAARRAVVEGDRGCRRCTSEADNNAELWAKYDDDDDDDGDAADGSDGGAAEAVGAQARQHSRLPHKRILARHALLRIVNNNIISISISIRLRAPGPPQYRPLLPAHALLRRPPLFPPHLPPAPRLPLLPPPPPVATTALPAPPAPSPLRPCQPRQRGSQLRARPPASALTREPPLPAALPPLAKLTRRRLGWAVVSCSPGRRAAAGSDARGAWSVAGTAKRADLTMRRAFVC
mmetsp:Transcript_10191/g.20900  ORF Transcript_10191/g.20900 Transcript_10191/m.20900 type:complete len:234 (-) Transcript_10191:43-744(-)